MKRKRIQLILLLIILLAFPLLVLAIKHQTQTKSNAAAADKLEAEGGVLGGNAQNKADSLASGGSYVLLGLNQTNNTTIGPQTATSTPLSQGTKFVSPTGSGTACSQSNPCSLATAVSNVNPGDIVFMRGGTYPITAVTRWDRSGSSTSPITIESYPGETATWDGSNQPNNSERMMRVGGNYYKFRKFEIKNMPDIGFYFTGSNNTIDGVSSHNNRNSGICVIGGNNNIFQNIDVSDNSDAGLTGGNYANGGNADGICISSGDGNKIINSIAARNSDDGMDAWTSTNTIISKSITTANGIGGGDGNGFKLGGPIPNNSTKIDHSIAYKNKVTGFDANSGVNIEISNVTSWNNGDYGIVGYATTKISNSIAINNITGNAYPNGIQSNNSWQRSGTPAFISTDPANSSFLKPTAGGGFEDIGAYAGISSNPTNIPSQINTPIPTSVPQAGTIYNVPQSIDGTGNTNVVSALQSFINSVPNGSSTNPSIIIFPAGKTYQVNPGLSFKGKKYITIDGSGTPTTYGNTNGATIKETGGGTPSDSIFNVSQADHIIIKNINGYGSNPSPATVNAYSSSREYQMGVISYGGTNIEIANVTFDNLNGDGLYMSDYSNGSGAWSENIWMHNSTVKRNGRMGVAWIAANNVTIENNSFSDIALDVWDFEPNYSNQGANGAIMRSNVVGDYGWSTIYSGYLAEDANVGTYANITIEGNTINGVSKSNNFAALSIDFDSAPAKTGTFIVRNNVTKNAKASPPYPVSLRNVSSPVLQNNTGNLSSGSFYYDAGGNGSINSSGNN